MNTWQTLRMACEARDIGRPVEAEHLFAECAPDFEYKRFVTRTVALRFTLDEGPDEYDDDYWVPLAADQQRRSWLAQFRAIDWLKWKRRATVSTSAFDSILRDVYSPDRVEMMSRTRIIGSYLTLGVLRIEGGV